MKEKLTALLLLLPALTGLLTADDTPPGDVTITYFYTPGCEVCEEFLASEVPELEKKLKLAIAVVKKDLLDPDIFKEFQDTARSLGADVTKFPVVIVGTTVLQGKTEIERLLQGVIRRAFDEGVSGTVAARSGGGGSGEMRLISVILAGLLDGVNPCAFTTLIFLIAALAVAGRGRREILAIGACFSLSVLVTYFLIGAGLLEALRLASSAPVVARIFQWVLFAILVVFAGISLYDWILIRRGRRNEIVMQLPKFLKLRIHASVRNGVRSAFLVGSSLAMGFFVSVFELACTGQIYFPTIAYLVKSEGGAGNYLLLLVYNLGFILPLLVVFALSYAGVGSKKITVVFQKHMGSVKLATAVLFAGLACLTLLT